MSEQKPASIDDLLAEVERRGWGYLMGDGAEGRHGNHWAQVYAPAPYRAGPGCDTPAAALRVALDAAIAATEEDDDAE